MNEDHSRNRIGNSINNLSLIRKIVFNLARLDVSMGEKLTLKQKMTRYINDFLILKILYSMSFLKFSLRKVFMRLP